MNFVFMHLVQFSRVISHAGAKMSRHPGVFAKWKDERRVFLFLLLSETKKFENVDF